MVKCRRCGRPLSDPDAIRAGIGPVCATKARGEAVQEQPDEAAHLTLYAPSLFEALVCERRDGRPAVNVPWVHRHHSPSGFEFGYTGSGPHDLALNVLALLLPIPKGVPKNERQAERMVGGSPLRWGEAEWERYDALIERMPRKLWDGSTVSREAYDLHHEFCRAFIAPLPEEGGRVEGEAIRQWIRARCAERGWELPLALREVAA